MAHRLNVLLEAVAQPPIAVAQRWVAGRTFPADKPLIDLAQAVPGYPPPDALLAHLAAAVRDPEIARYSEGLGVSALREALAGHMSESYGGAVSPDQVAISAGCNQAFCLAMTSLAQAGDEVILPLPYYFNHRMWLDTLGIRAIDLMFRPDRGGVPDPAEAAELITERTRAIVLVTPNNPTGTIYPPEVIAEFFALARARGLALVLDETYKDFIVGDAAPHELFADDDWSDTLVQLYSFSKVYCLTGYRVGSLIASRAMIDQAAKVLDCVAVCAPRIGQEASLFGIRNLAGWREDNRTVMHERLTALREAMGRTTTGFELVSAGAYFAYLRRPDPGRDGDDLAHHLADTQNILCLPGRMFGPEQDDYLRFAFANVPADRMPEIARRLAAASAVMG